MHSREWLLGEKAIGKRTRDVSEGLHSKDEKMEEIISKKNEIYDDMVQHRHDGTSEKARLDTIYNPNNPFLLLNFCFENPSAFLSGGQSDRMEGVKGRFYIHFFRLKKTGVLCVWVYGN